MNTKHAAVMQGHFGILVNGDLVSNQCTIHSLADLCSLATREKITHLWITPETGIEPTREFAIYDTSSWSLRLNWKREHIMSLTGWKLPSGGQHQFTIIFPKYTSWATKDEQSGWVMRATPLQLLATIRLLERALGVRIAGSPSTAGWELLRLLRGDWIDQKPTVNLRELHFDKGAAQPIIWQRLMSDDEQECRYLHKFDKSSAYLAAAQSEFYGVGTPVHVWHGNDALMKPQQVGVWHVTLPNGNLSNAMFPPVWKKSEGWLAGPYIRLMHSAGIEMVIDEGYVFPGRHQLLAKWANTVWTARKSFDPTEDICQGFAQEAMKKIAVATVGVTGYHGFDEEEHSDKDRPDIKMQTIARAAEVMHFNIKKVWEQEYMAPLIVATDALFYLSDNPNGGQAIPTIMERNGKLGGFKYEGTVDLDDQFSYENDDTSFRGSLRDLLNEKRSVNTKLEVLNSHGWVTYGI